MHTKKYDDYSKYYMKKRFESQIIENLSRPK